MLTSAPEAIVWLTVTLGLAGAFFSCATAEPEEKANPPKSNENVNSFFICICLKFKIFYQEECAIYTPS
jgi:hypothetical protein